MILTGSGSADRHRAIGSVLQRADHPEADMAISVAAAFRHAKGRRDAYGSRGRGNEIKIGRAHV